MTLTIKALEGLPLIKPGDDLAGHILHALDQNNLSLENGDILVVAQKIVSKAENRLINLADIHPSNSALDLAKKSGKDPRIAELILQESNEILRTRIGSVIVEHKLGFVCANAGIDHSNVAGVGTSSEEWVLLLPKDPDRSAENLRNKIEEQSKKKIGVMIIDSHGRAWRLGTVGVVIGLSGIPGLLDERGWPDLFGFTLQITVVAVADELAAAASLVMGQASEGLPVVLVRGFPYALREGSLAEILRPREQDMFR